MFSPLRRNFGTAALTLPLTALMGFLFNASLWETLYATALLYLVSLALLVLDDLYKPSTEGMAAPYTEKELLELDFIVTPIFPA